MFRCKSSCTPSIGQYDRYLFLVVNLLHGMFFAESLWERLCSGAVLLHSFDRSMRSVLLYWFAPRNAFLAESCSPLIGFDRSMRSVILLFLFAPRNVLVESPGNSRCSRCNALAPLRSANAIGTCCYLLIR